MSNQARLSRHASGILPSRQFFAPRKPLHSSSSVRRKSTYAINPNTRISLQPTSPQTPQPVLSSTNVLFSASPSTYNDQVEIPLTEFPPYVNVNESAPVDNIITTSPEFNKEYLQRRQEQARKKLGSIESIPQSVIDSVLEPSDSLEPRYSRSSYKANNGLSKSFSKKKKREQEVKISPYAHLIKLFPPVVYTPDKEPEEPSRGRKRVYQVWPGRNRFFFKGRIMTSRDFPAFCVAFSALVVPSLLFLGFTGPFLYTHVSPVVVIIFVYLFLLALVSMLRTSWSDPGIIPRNLDPNPPTEDLEDPEHHVNVINNSQHPYYPPRSVPLPKDIKMNGATLILKYCETCRIYRPPRCSHCRQCDNCVEGEDHHCIWLNNCIGRRNYRTFFTLIATATIICLYILFFSIVHLYFISDYQKKSFVDSLMDAPVSFCLALLAFFLMWSVGGLTCYHTYLILNNMTTHEQLRAPMDRRNGRRNPYDFQRISLNCSWMLCRPTVHSTVHRRAFIDPRDENGSRMSIEPQKPLRHQQIQMTTTTTTTTITTEEGNNSGDTFATSETRVCVNISDDDDDDDDDNDDEEACMVGEKNDFDRGTDDCDRRIDFDQEKVSDNNESKADVAVNVNASGYSETSAHSYTSADSPASTTPLTPTSSSREQQEELDNIVA